MIDQLLEQMAAAGDRPAIVCGGRTWSYRWLLERVAACNAELEQHGVSQDVVSLEADYSPETCALLLALFQRGAVVVPLGTSLPPGTSAYVLDVTEVQVRLREETGWRPERVGRLGRMPSHPLTMGLRGEGHPGLVLLTTGSTGEPRAALHDVARFLAKFQKPRPARRTLSFLLFDHIGGQNTLFHTLASGGTLVVPEARDPDTVCRAIERHAVELLPTSPTFVNLLLLSEAYTRYDLSSLTAISYGTEPMPDTTLERMREVAPRARLLQTYGLTELGILRTRSRASDSAFMTLGGEGVETRVVDGVLHVRTATSMLGYLNALSPFDADGWFNTGDSVVVEGDEVRVVGRQRDLINVGGLKVVPSEVESVLLALPYVTDATVRGEPNAITGQEVVARVTLTAVAPNALIRRRIRHDCLGRLEPYKIPSRVEVATGPLHGARLKRCRQIADEGRA